MKAISLWQPWASALFTPLKPDETRSWVLPDWAIGVPIAIHAAQRDTSAERRFWEENVLQRIDHSAFRDIGIGRYADLPRAGIIGTVVFGSPVRTALARYARSEAWLRWGDYSDGRWAWPVVEKTLYSRPIPAVGRQKFFNWSSVPLPVFANTSASFCCGGES